MKFRSFFWVSVYILTVGLKYKQDTTFFALSTVANVIICCLYKAVKFDYTDQVWQLSHLQCLSKSHCWRFCKGRPLFFLLLLFFRICANQRKPTRTDDHANTLDPCEEMSGASTRVLTTVAKFGLSKSREVSTRINIRFSQLNIKS